ncbi:MAG TPA: PEGA domain-containing protein [Candidatus Eisenbacteria bacterium]|jgi:hypothetical protein
MSASDPEAAFAPISPNPYIVGNPVRDRSMFFGREAEFELVRSRFKDSEQGGGLLVFCGERRSGKTSILFQILDKRLGPQFIPVLIDMQSMAITNEADFLGKIAEEVLEALGDRAADIPFPDFTRGASHADTFRKFIENTLRRCPDRKLILLFDEYELFESKIDAGVLSRDVLQILKHLMENQSVFLVFTGSQHLEQRRRDYWQILPASTWKQISYLEPSDARKLICNPVDGRASYAEGTVDAIYRLSAGQPFYTQAICQSLVDQLNERKTREVTHELIGEVVRGLVSNPLPQMIFLWDSLGKDERLTLALLAEALPKSQAVASDANLIKLIRLRNYPLAMSRGRIATALDHLFRTELLTKEDSIDPPGFAFRMDLWRLWIRRMHSAWQVMRELGLEIRQPATFNLGPLKISLVRASGAAVVLLLVGGGAIAWQRFVEARRAHPAPVDLSGASGPVGAVVLQATPGDAGIEVDGQPMATGTLRATLRAGSHVLRIRAPGYAETTITAPLVAHRQTPNGPLIVDPFRSKVALRALLADVLVTTVPPGAEVTVDGNPHGKSPVTVRGLVLERQHEIVATLPGHEPGRRLLQLHVPGKLEPANLPLAVSTFACFLTSEPPGATIKVDGVTRGTTPFQLSAVSFGRHQVLALREGYVAKDTSVDVSDATKVIHLALAPEPGGEVVIQGDYPAQFYLDGKLVNSAVPNSGVLEVASGAHEIKVVYGANLQASKTLVVKSRQRVTYDFSADKTTETPVSKTP